MTELDDAEQVEVKVSLIRDYFEGSELPEALQTALDSAQGPVFNKEVPHNYLIIKIIGD
jgi:hypothetical protein